MVCASMFGSSASFRSDQLFRRLLLQIGFAGNGLVHIGHISRMMLVMMDLHGLRIDVRFQRVFQIGSTLPASSSPDRLCRQWPCSHWSHKPHDACHDGSPWSAHRCSVPARLSDRINSSGVFFSRSALPAMALFTLVT